MTFLPLPLIRKRPTKPAASALPEDEDGEETRYKPIDLKIVRRLSKWLAPHKWRYVTGVSLGFVAVVISLSGPWFVKELVNYTTRFAQGDLGAAVTRAMAIRHAGVIALLWGAASAINIILERARILIMTRAGESVQFDIRRAIFAHLQKLSMSYYDKTKLGRIISRCTSDVASLREVNVWGIDAVLSNLLMMVLAGVAMALFASWRLFAAVCWLGPVLYVMNRVYLKKSGLGWQTIREGFTRVSTNLAENITGVRVVTAFNRQSPNLDEFNRLQDINTFNNVSVSRLNGVYQPLLGIVGFLGKVIILAYGGYLVVAHPSLVSVGAVVAAFLYWDQFMNQILVLGNWYNVYLQAMAGGERVFDLLDTPPDVHDLPDAHPLPRIAGNVKFENVVFGYNPERPVLHGISFESHPGQMIALVGATGSGKSSIISLISRFYQPQQGRVLVDGHDIRHVTGDSLHKQTGLVLQVNYLFTGTVMENIRYANPEATEQDVIAAARAIGSHDSIMTLKDGYQSEVGERGANMSLGQRQLICFTRAFLADPRIFMLDEATSAVDTTTELIVQRSLEKLLAGRTTFVVAHRLSTIMAADLILVIDAGQIIERGTHRELVAASGKYAHLYEQFVQHTE
jgi:ABC-type multidrug transport system fused ATPase/permease subunit